MTTSSRVLTNDHRDCRLIKLDANDPSSPLIVAQEGYAPGDVNSRMRMFYLQRDGFWIDEIARSTLPESEVGAIVFESASEVIKLLSGMFGAPLIRHLPVTEADVQAYAAKARGASATDLFRQYLSRYRAAKGK